MARDTDHLQCLCHGKCHKPFAMSVPWQVPRMQCLCHGSYHKPFAMSVPWHVPQTICNVCAMASATNHLPCLCYGMYTTNHLQCLCHGTYQYFQHGTCQNTNRCVCVGGCVGGCVRVCVLKYITTLHENVWRLLRTFQIIVCANNAHFLNRFVLKICA